MKANDWIYCTNCKHCEVHEHILQKVLRSDGTPEVAVNYTCKPMKLPIPTTKRMSCVWYCEKEN